TLWTRSAAEPSQTRPVSCRGQLAHGLTPHPRPLPFEGRGSRDAPRATMGQRSAAHVTFGPFERTRQPSAEKCFRHALDGPARDRNHEPPGSLLLLCRVPEGSSVKARPFERAPRCASGHLTSIRPVPIFGVPAEAQRRRGE